jgi:hypothetical protein
MNRTATVLSIFGLFVLVLSLSVNLRAQTGPPMFRSPADAGRTSRYRKNLIRYNEACAVKSVYSLLSAEATYQATAGNGNYGSAKELSEENLISSVLAEGHRCGYLFRIRFEKYSSESPSSFEVAAVPRKYGRTGRRSFYVNEKGAIVAADRKGGEAHAEDDPLDP